MASRETKRKGRERDFDWSKVTLEHFAPRLKGERQSLARC